MLEILLTLCLLVIVTQTGLIIYLFFHFQSRLDGSLKTVNGAWEQKYFELQEKQDKRNTGLLDEILSLAGARRIGKPVEIENVIKFPDPELPVNEIDQIYYLDKIVEEITEAAPELSIYSAQELKMIAPELWRKAEGIVQNQTTPLRVVPSVE